MTTEQEDQLLEQAKIAGTAPRMNAEDAKKLIAAMPVEQILKDAQPKMEAAVMESAANERAAREPLPGPAADIFNLEPLVVKTSIGDVTIRPMVSFDINIFKTINSPFYEIMMQSDSKEAANKLFTSEEESYELIYQFTHPVKETYNLFKKGMAIFKDTVMEEVAFKYHPQDAALLVSKIMEHVFRVNLARVGFESSPEAESGSGDGTKKKLMSPEITST
jgi:hypothetical protein